MLKLNRKNWLHVPLLTFFVTGLSACSQKIDLTKETEVNGTVIELNTAEDYFVIEVASVWENEDGSLSMTTNGLANREDSARIYFTEQTVLEGTLVDELGDITISNMDDIRVGDTIIAFGNGGRGEFFADEIQIFRIE